MLINKFDFLYTISVDKVIGAPQLLPEHLLWRIVGLADQKQVPVLVSVQFLHFVAYTIQYVLPIYSRCFCWKFKLQIHLHTKGILLFRLCEMIRSLIITNNNNNDFNNESITKWISLFRLGHFSSNMIFDMNLHITMLLHSYWTKWATIFFFTQVYRIRNILQE